MRERKIDACGVKIKTIQINSSHSGILLDLKAPPLSPMMSLPKEFGVDWHKFGHTVEIRHIRGYFQTLSKDYNVS